MLVKRHRMVLLSVYSAIAEATAAAVLLLPKLDKTYAPHMVDFQPPGNYVTYQAIVISVYKVHNSK